MLQCKEEVDFSAADAEDENETGADASAENMVLIEDESEDSSDETEQDHARNSVVPAAKAMPRSRAPQKVQDEASNSIASQARPVPAPKKMPSSMAKKPAWSQVKEAVPQLAGKPSLSRPRPPQCPPPPPPRKRRKLPSRLLSPSPDVVEHDTRKHHEDSKAIPVRHAGDSEMPARARSQHKRRAPPPRTVFSQVIAGVRAQATSGPLRGLCNAARAERRKTGADANSPPTHSKPHVVREQALAAAAEAGKQEVESSSIQKPKRRSIRTIASFDGEVVIDATDIPDHLNALLGSAKQSATSASVQPVHYEYVPDNMLEWLRKALPSGFSIPGGQVQAINCKLHLPEGGELHGIGFAFNQKTGERAAALAALVAGESSAKLQGYMSGPEWQHLISEVAYARPARRATEHPKVLPGASTLPPAMGAELKSLASRLRGDPVPNAIEEIDGLRYAHNTVKNKFSYGPHAGHDVLSAFVGKEGNWSARPRFSEAHGGMLLHGVPPLVVVAHRGVKTVINGNRRLKAAFEYKRFCNRKVFANVETWSFDNDLVPPAVIAKYVLAMSSTTGGVDVKLR